jgi:hypothetical protein
LLHQLHDKHAATVGMFTPVSPCVKHRLASGLAGDCDSKGLARGSQGLLDVIQQVTG